MKYAIKVNEVKKENGNVKGFATVVFGDSFKITNIAIVENKDKEFREKLYSEIERAYTEAKEKQQEQAKEQSQKQGKEQSQDKDGFMKASGEPLPFR